MYIESVPNRNSPPCILLRQSSRQGKKVIKRTLANLSSWPEPLVEGLRTLLKGGTAVENLAESFEKVRSLPHGHVGAVWGTLRQLGLLALLSRKPGRERQLVAAMVVARILDPGSKLATVRGLDSESQLSTLATVAEIANAQVDGLYAALDWLLARQSRLEKKLARRHLQEGCLVLYDLTSSYFEERRCPLAKLGYSRDGKKGKLQIVIGMLCNRQGCPVAVEAFEGNVADPSTLDSQIEKLQKRFGLRLVVIVGDRGLITSARISEDLQPQGLGWITALRAPQIGKLLDQGHLQLSLFDDRDLAQIRSLDYPGERLIVCRNPLLAEERSRKRRESLAATREQLERIVEAVDRPKRPLRGQDKIGLRVGRVLHRWGMAKHFQLHISKDSFQFQLQGESIDREASLDGIYVIRTSVPEREMEAEQVVDNYKALSLLERAFRCTKTVDLKVRPIYHRLPERVKAHVLVCMLAYYVEWHMRQDLAPLLFDDDDRQTARQLRESPVSPARRSPKAERKARSHKTEDGFPVHSFQTLLADLSTITRDTIQPKIPGVQPFHKTTLPTPLQQRALDLLGVRL